MYAIDATQERHETHSSRPETVISASTLTIVFASALRLSFHKLRVGRCLQAGRAQPPEPASQRRSARPTWLQPSMQRG